MDFFETADDVQAQISDIRHQLEDLGGDAPRTMALARLKQSSPMHPILLLRVLFLVLACLCLLAAVLAFLVPFLAPFVDPSIPSTVQQLQRAMGGTPLPIAIAGGAALLVIGWFAIDQAAVAVGRGSQLTPVEARERDRLSSELSRLSRQRDLIDRANSEPKPPRSRYQNSGSDISTASMYQDLEPAPSYLAPPSMPPGPLNQNPRTATPVPQRASDGYARFRTPITNGREVVPISRPSTISLNNEPEYVTEDRPIETPTDQFPQSIQDSGYVDHAYVVESVEDAPTYTTQRPDAGYVSDAGFPPNSGSGPQDSGYVVDSTSHQGSAFNRVVATETPDFARIDEEWLREAIAKATALADSFPVQARLEFNQESFIPFTLVLERATPAMAVRAMMAFVEFLSTIAYPRTARIELQSVAHLDRTFHRNVRAACAPYFADGVRVSNAPGRIDLSFDSPDARWDRYPLIPVTR